MTVARSSSRQRAGLAHRAADDDVVDAGVLQRADVLGQAVGQERARSSSNGVSRAGMTPVNMATSTSEQVVLAVANQRGDARAVARSSTWRSRPRRRTAGSPGGLAAGEVGGRGGLVGDGDQRRVHLAPVAVGPPALVVQRREPGAADGDLGLADAPGTAEGVRDRRPRSRAPRAARGRTRRGPAAAARRGPRRRRWSGRRRRWRRRTRGGCGRSAGRRRRARPRRPRRARPARRAGPCPTRRPTRAPARPARRRRARRRGPRPWRRPCGRRTGRRRARRPPTRAGGRGQQRGEVVARAAPPAPPGARRPRSRASARRAARACAARPAQRGEVLAACRRRRPATGARRPAPRRRRARASAACRANEPGPKDGLHHVRRREQQRVRAGAVAVGDDRHAAAGRGEQRGDLRRVEARAVARDEQDAVGAAPAAAPAPRAAAGLWPASRGSSTTVAPTAPAASARAARA